MTNRVEVYIGTAGHSAWFSSDQGTSWLHPNSHSGMYLEARVWCFSSHLKDKQFLYAGTDMGLFRWDEYTTRWTSLPSPMKEVWALTQDPNNAQILYAGTRPASFYKSLDGGLNWQHIPIPNLVDFSDVNMGPTRCTQLLIDPYDSAQIWLTVEIGGIFHSKDFGQTWEMKVQGLVSIDVHGILITKNTAQEKIYLATTNRGLHRSLNTGQTWEMTPLQSPWQYTRAITRQENNPSVIWLTNGNGPPGDSGKLLRSENFGESFSEIKLPNQLHSTPWCIAIHPTNPQLIFLATNLGQVFRSDDAGNKWLLLPHQFGEIRALHWRTTDYPDDRPPHAVTTRPPLTIFR
jgi:frataxin-like iron-binding protein CyaY